MTDDRREQNRISLLVEVLWDGATGRCEARTSDLSLGGCFVDTIAQAGTGEILAMKLRLPGGEWIDVKGEVAYELPRMGFGVHFIELSDDNKKRLQVLIDSQGP